MGRTPPWIRKIIRTYQPMLKSWIVIMQRDTQGSESKNEVNTSVKPTQKYVVMSKNVGKKLQALIGKVWHMSDNFQWMEPLPNFHRRWMAVSTLVLLLALLWPYSRPDNYSPSPQNVSLPMQASLQGEQATPLAPSQNWQSYRIQPGQTLAQLFRDNNLTVSDVFTMAQVEGTDKPLSNLKVGQEVKIQQDAQGRVTALEVTNGQNIAVLFIRQSDGNYRRSQ